MAVLSCSLISQFIFPNPCIPTNNTPIFLNEIPGIDLSGPQAKTFIAKAIQNFNFFKLIDHGISLDIIANLKTQAMNFFALCQNHKNRTGHPDPIIVLCSEMERQEIGLEHLKGTKVQYICSCCLDTNALRAATASADFSSKVWDASTGVELHSFEHKHIVRACAFSEVDWMLYNVFRPHHYYHY
ncbi:hypothetical protein K1719_005447 [Acacia pycnantha]|nr:hypothetical protein K1719_005447 [Acacia pycnantha]